MFALRRKNTVCSLICFCRLFRGGICKSYHTHSWGHWYPKLLQKPHAVCKCSSLLKEDHDLGNTEQLLSMVGWRQGKAMQQLFLCHTVLWLGQPASFSWDIPCKRNTVSSFLGRARQRSCGEQSPPGSRAAHRAWPSTLQEAAAVVAWALGELQVSSLLLSPECSCERLIAWAGAPYVLLGNSMCRRYLVLLAKIVATN